MYGIDIYYLTLIIPAMILTIIAQVKVKSAYRKYSEVYSSRGYTAADITRRILDDNGLHQISIQHVAGELTDHYDPQAGVIRLSDSVINSSSVAAIGVAAHEAGHAIQRKERYAPIEVRNSILPVVQLSSRIGLPLAFIGLIFGLSPLVKVGIILFSAVVLFQLITLPVELDASRRAIKTLSENAYLEGEELTGAKKVLTAAAMTYLAAAIVAVMNLIRLILLSRSRD